MRFFEFKLPTPGSAFDTELKQHLLTLINNAKKLPETDPKRIQFNQFLQNIKAEAGITEDPVAEVNQETVNAVLSFLAKQGDKTATMYLMDGAKILGDKRVQAALQKKAEVHTELGREEADAEFKKWYNNIKSVLLMLGKKAQGYTDLTDEDFKSMASTQRASAKKVQLNAEKFAQDLGQSLQSMFMNKVFGQEETKITKEQVLTFLQDALDGSVINNASLVKQQGVGNLENYFDPRYKNIFDEIKTELFKLKPPASGSANVGPGELALAMLGNPAEKPDKGDIKIGEEMFEIKAGAGSVGGRFNSSEVGKANEAWADWTAGLKEIVPNNKFTDRFNNVTTSSGKQRTKIASKYNWNDTGIKALNTEVLGPYSDFSKTQKLLTNVFRRIVKNYAELKDFDKAIKLMIAPDGTIKPDYMKYYGKIVYDSYNKADGVTNIILINTNNLQFTVIRDSKDLMNRVGQDFKPTGGFNWNDNQQTASPQFIISK
jgi:hypothetical protein